MTREEHIALAEELVRKYQNKESGLGYGVWHPTPYELQLAQVHATLALATPSSATVGDVQIRPAVPR